MTSARFHVLFTFSLVIQNWVILRGNYFSILSIIAGDVVAVFQDVRTNNALLKLCYSEIYSVPGFILCLAHSAHNELITDTAYFSAHLLKRPLRTVRYKF